MGLGAVDEDGAAHLDGTSDHVTVAVLMVMPRCALRGCIESRFARSDQGLVGSKRGWSDLSKSDRSGHWRRPLRPHHRRILEGVTRRVWSDLRGGDRSSVVGSELAESSGGCPAEDG